MKMKITVTVDQGFGIVVKHLYTCSPEFDVQNHNLVSLRMHNLIKI